jgi:probable HAF family extracellular repeat protein
LGKLPGGRYHSSAEGINNAGTIVGYSDTGPGAYHAAVWYDGTVATDLNSLLSPTTVDAGWLLQSAQAINDRGSITGGASNALTGESHAFLLTPLTDKEQCKDGGWLKFDFPNQGQCIQFVNTGK